MSYDLVLDAGARLRRLRWARFAVAVVMVTVMIVDAVGSLVFGWPSPLWVYLSAQLGLGAVLMGLSAKIERARQAFLEVATERYYAQHGR